MKRELHTLASLAVLLLLASSCISFRGDRTRKHKGSTATLTGTYEQVWQAAIGAWSEYENKGAFGFPDAGKQLDYGVLPDKSEGRIKGGAFHWESSFDIQILIDRKNPLEVRRRRVCVRWIETNDMGGGRIFRSHEINLLKRIAEEINKGEPTTSGTIPPGAGGWCAARLCAGRIRQLMGESP